MITFLVFCDQQGVMTGDPFFTTTLYPKHHQAFLEQTQDHILIASEDAFTILLEKTPIPERDIVIISESLFNAFKKQDDIGYAEHKGMKIVNGYLTALPLASKDRRGVTILGGPSLFEQIVRIHRTVDRLILFRMNTTFSGSLLFPSEIKDFFSPVFSEVWEQNKDQPETIIEVWWKRG